MSLLNTKPRYFPSAVATESGWVNPVTGELLVSVGNLKSKLALEDAQSGAPTPAKKVKAVEVVVEPVVVVEEIEPVEEVEVTVQKDAAVEEIKPVKTRKPYTKKVVTEQTEKSVPAEQQLIGEVVEHDLDKPVIGE